MSRQVLITGVVIIVAYNLVLRHLPFGSAGLRRGNAKQIGGRQTKMLRIASPGVMMTSHR